MNPRRRTLLLAKMAYLRAERDWLSHESQSRELTWVLRDIDRLVQAIKDEVASAAPFIALAMPVPSEKGACGAAMNCGESGDGV